MRDVEYVRDKKMICRLLDDNIPRARERAGGFRGARFAQFTL